MSLEDIVLGPYPDFFVLKKGDANFRYIARMGVQY